MKRIALIAIALLMPLWASAQEMVERIDITGNERVTRDTILYYLTSREGDYYNLDTPEKRLSRPLVDRLFLQYQGHRGMPGPGARLSNSPLRKIRSSGRSPIKTGKKVKEDDITNKLKEKDESLLPYSYYSPAKLQRVKKTIEDLLFEKGLGGRQSRIRDHRKKEPSEVEVLFKIDEGPKVRIAEVEFSGSPKLPQSVLREALKENKPHSLLSWVMGKDTYKQGKLADDLAGVKKAFQENGYMEAVIGEPKTDEVVKGTFWPFSKKRKMVRLTIPVEAGFRYKVGEIKVEGNKTFKTSGIMTQIPFKKGEIYNTAVREKSVEDLGELFRNFGYLYAQILPVETLDPKTKVVNVTYQIAEGEICFLRKIDFKGNVFTKDKVIRREILLREGDVFMVFGFFKDSVLRVKQLGLVDLEKDPEIIPDPENPTQFDVTVAVTELQRNNIQFTAGYSGYEGTFVAAGYQTVNFLGAGETLDITAQYGKRIRNYSFGFTEPYLFDRPISAGFNIYDRYLIYYDLYNRKGRGFDVTA